MSFDLGGVYDLEHPPSPVIRLSRAKAFFAVVHRRNLKRNSSRAAWNLVVTTKTTSLSEIQIGASRKTRESFDDRDSDPDAIVEFRTLPTSRGIFIAKREPQPRKQYKTSNGTIGIRENDQDKTNAQTQSFQPIRFLNGKDCFRRKKFFRIHATQGSRRCRTTWRSAQSSILK